MFGRKQHGEALEIAGEEPAFLDLSPEEASQETTRKAVHAIRRSLAFSQIVSFLMQSPLYRHYAIADLEWLVFKLSPIFGDGLSNKTALAMLFKAVEGAQKRRRRLDGHNQLPKIVQGVKFTDGLDTAAKLEAPQAKFAAT